MKILVLGSSGMAGHVISTYLESNDHTVTRVAGHKKNTKNTILIDVFDSDKLALHLKNNDYDAIVNAVGLLISTSEEHKDWAVYLNSYLPHFLESLTKNSHTKLVHLSTDCVFSGENGPYSETSVYDGTLFYDRTKALGEIVNDKDLTFRMSIIGPDINADGVGLFNWFMRQDGEIKGFTGALWNGITTIELAKAIDKALQSKITGIYHLTPSENISKFDLLKLFNETFKQSKLTITPQDHPVSNKTLLNNRDDFDFNVSNYPEMVEEMSAWIETHKDLYPHYFGGAL